MTDSRANVCYKRRAVVKCQILHVLDSLYWIIMLWKLICNSRLTFMKIKLRLGHTKTAKMRETKVTILVF